ncbi:MAG TPA: NAD(P)-dependent oxidoreductase [Actinomycetes bacterium]|nr:NAD(P)-dependent oxidoreductase [Actinomycetes bacterium]
MSVVVTGSSGFVGRTVLAELARRGRTVVAVDRRPAGSGTGSPAGASVGGPAPLVLTGDLLHRDELVDAALDAASAVLHLAGCPGVRDDAPDVDRRRHRDNVLATARVLAAVPAHVPVVVASSSSVYGGSTGRPSRESDRPAPRGGYARSKVAVEELCARRAAAGGRVTAVRPFTVVGEGQRPDMAVARWLAAAYADRPLEVFGSLERTRDLTDVREVARVLATLAEPGCAPTGVLNVGTGRPHTLAEVVEAVAEATGRTARIRVTPAAAVEPADTWADTARLRAVVGFVPRTDLREVVRRQAASTALGADRSDPLAVGA